MGPPYFNLTFTPLMAALAILLPAGPLLAWKRGDAQGVAQRLWVAALIALGVGLVVYAAVSPRQAFGAAGIGLGAWLIAGALAELVERTRLFRMSAGESLRRLVGLPRGAWGMTLAHLGLGVFILGACFETGWKAESAETLRIGQSLNVGGYHLTLDAVRDVDGPNYDAERALIHATRHGKPICTGEPERRFYPAGGQTTSRSPSATAGRRTSTCAGRAARRGRGAGLAGAGLLESLGDADLPGPGDHGARRGDLALGPAAAAWRRAPAAGAAGVTWRGLLAALAGVLCIAAASDPAERLPDPAQEARARAIFEDVRCLVCQNESIDDSEAELAGDLRRIVREQVRQGRSDAEIKRFLTDRYGEFVLLTPAFNIGNLALWGGPFLAAALGLVLLLRRLRNRSDGEALSQELSAEEVARVKRLSETDSA